MSKKATLLWLATVAMLACEHIEIVGQATSKPNEGLGGGGSSASADANLGAGIGLGGTDGAGGVPGAACGTAKVSCWDFGGGISEELGIFGGCEHQLEAGQEFARCTGAGVPSMPSILAFRDDGTTSYIQLDYRVRIAGLSEGSALDTHQLRVGDPSAIFDFFFGELPNSVKLTLADGTIVELGVPVSVGTSEFLAIRHVIDLEEGWQSIEAAGTKILTEEPLPAGIAPGAVVMQLGANWWTEGISVAVDIDDVRLELR